MRLVVGIATIADGVARIHSGTPAGAILLSLLQVAAAILLLIGLWTPISGSLVALLGVWGVLSHTTAALSGVLLSTMGAGLALLGPGVWSIDARLFGWKRIDLGD